MGNKSSGIDLVSLFGQVASSLTAQKDTLNQMDSHNHDHGDNMVEIFEVITQAMREKNAASPADQLAYASEILHRKQSGSAQAYANGLAQASQQFQGQSAVTMENAGMLIQTLLGGGQTAPSGQESGGDMFGSLLGGLLGGGQAAAPQQNDPGLDVGDLLNAGMAFLNAKQQGSSNVEAALNAVLAASPLGQSAHRQQSSTLVANTLMQVLGNLGK